MAKLRALLVLISCWGGALFAQEVHLKSRDIDTRQSSAPARFASGATRSLAARIRGTEHQIIQFDHQPGVDDLTALLAAGYTVTGAIPDNALVVVVPRGTVVSGQIDGVRWQGPLEVGDKISPQILAASGEVQAIIEFHSDVSRTSQEQIARLENVSLQTLNNLRTNHALISASIEQIGALANHDEVSYIFPADPDLLANGAVGCVGLLTLSGPVGQYANLVHGWTLDPDHIAHLGYFLGALTPKVPAATVESEILRAMNAWASVANVVFSAADNATAARTVAIKFASRAHGDAYPFDGPGGIVAHTFYPVPVNAESIAGDTHLDADENWHSGSDLDIYTVVLHEMGHALGLGHTDNPGDVMYPYYRRGMQLSKNDIGAVQALYGAPVNAAPPAAITLAPPAVPSAAPLKLVLNPVTPPGQAASTTISGTVSGGTPPYGLQYQSDQGASGSISPGNGGSWSVQDVPLAVGSNTITATAYDSANATASQSATVTRLAAPVAATSPVSIRITTPAASVSTAKSASLSLAGTASGGSGVATVTWQTSTGATGTAVGTGHWIATNVPLFSGTNTILMRAYDLTGASAWATAIVVRQ